MRPFSDRHSRLGEPDELLVCKSGFLTKWITFREALVREPSRRGFPKKQLTEGCVNPSEKAAKSTPGRNDLEKRQEWAKRSLVFKRKLHVAPPLS